MRAFAVLLILVATSARADNVRKPNPFDGKWTAAAAGTTMFDELEIHVQGPYATATNAENWSVYPGIVEDGEIEMAFTFLQAFPDEHDETKKVNGKVFLRAKFRFTSDSELSLDFANPSTVIFEHAPNRTIDQQIPRMVFHRHQEKKQ